jgi:hypothetical protein
MALKAGGTTSADKPGLHIMRTACITMPANRW